MTSVPAGETLTAICISNFVESRARGAVPAERLLLVCVGVYLWFVMILFCLLSFPRGYLIRQQLWSKVRREILSIDLLNLPFHELLSDWE